MRYYILDDDINVIKMLTSIVEQEFERTVVGTSISPETALSEIGNINPDIVIIDYLMPGFNGAEVIEKIKMITDQIDFVMISQVADKEMISDAYKAGLSFFISKPINKIEVEAVLRNLELHIETRKKLSSIINVLDIRDSKSSTRDNTENIRNALRDLGLFGDRSTSDILGIATLRLSNPHKDINEIISIYAGKSMESSKTVKQRIRRSITRGLRNLAYIGIEDYMNETFLKYSNSVYDFEAVKTEMDVIRGKNKSKSKCSVAKFLDAISVI